MLFRSQKKIPIFVHHCEVCNDDIYLVKETKEHDKCGNELMLRGSFWLRLEYSSNKEVLELLGDDWDTLALFRAKVKGWGELGNNEKDFPFNEKNLELLHDMKPDIVNLVVGLCQVRNLFGLIDLEDFSKNSNGQSSISDSTKKRKSNRQIAENVSKDTVN